MLLLLYLLFGRGEKFLVDLFVSISLYYGSIMALYSFHGPARRLSAASDVLSLVYELIPFKSDVY